MLHHTILSLGDSYTIGEGVPLHESFPYQMVQMLRREGLKFQPPEIVAQTGWTSSELKAHLSHTLLNERYDFVSLLIGVNNQYRGQSITDYESDFRFLLSEAIRYAVTPHKVIVLSIPDWGVTPFAEGRDRNKIAEEIDKFNSVNSTTATEAGARYIEITKSTRQAGAQEEFLTSDKLHYSGKEYRKWAGLVSNCIKDELSKYMKNKQSL